MQSQSLIFALFIPASISPPPPLLSPLIFLFQGPDDPVDEENPTPGGTIRDLSKLSANDALLKEQQHVRSQFRASMRAKYLAKK